MTKVANIVKNPTFRFIASGILSVAVWLSIWELLAYIVDLKFIFPGAIETFGALGNLIATLTFWKTVALSMLRIFIGLILGVILGAVFALLYQFLPFLRNFITIGMTVTKSTPVASIIMIMWVVMINGSKDLPAVIALLMVAPIIWQNLCDAFSSIDKELSEVCDVFCFSVKKKLRLLILPQLTKYFVPAFLTSIGLAWKSGIAAEIISYTKDSIGRNISNAKSFFEGDVMFAWTFTVVILSLLFEYTSKFLLRRWRR